MKNAVYAGLAAAIVSGIAAWAALPAGAGNTTVQVLDFENVAPGTVSLVYTRDLAGPIPVWGFDDVQQVPVRVSSTRGSNVLSPQSIDDCRRVHVGLGTACGCGAASLKSFRILGTTEPTKIFYFDRGGNVGPTVDGVQVAATGSTGSQTITLGTGATGLADDAVAEVVVMFHGTGGAVDDFYFSCAPCACDSPPPPPPPPTDSCDDWFTGGGWITGTPSGAKGTFGVGGGLKKGALWGHLNYIDHGTGMHVHWQTITGYETLTATRRRVTGTCTIDDASGFTYVLEVEDNGEPGRADVYSLTLSTGYRASGLLNGGGNIQLHKANCTTKGTKQPRKRRGSNR